MKVARLIIYQGSEDWVKKTLEKSLIEGCHEMGPNHFITVVQLDTNTVAIPSHLFPLRAAEWAFIDIDEDLKNEISD